MGQEKELDVGEALLSWGEKTVPLDGVVGFYEQFDDWTGRAHLVVRGPDWRLPIGVGYGAQRRLLRRTFPNHPFESEWSMGYFPSLPLGMPTHLATLLEVIVWLGFSAAVTLAAKPLLGGLILVVGAYPLIRLRDRVVVRAMGIRLGPVWSPTIPWYEVSGVYAHVQGSQAKVWVRTRGARNGVVLTTLPAILLPALRARCWRLGGIRLRLEAPGNEARYQVWVGPAAGIPWGILLGVSIGAWHTAEPFKILLVGFLVVVGHSLLGGVVFSRASGWGTGAILYGTALYALFLAAISLGAWL